MPAHFSVSGGARGRANLAGRDRQLLPGALTWVDCQAEAMQLHDRDDEIETRVYARPISYVVRPTESSQQGRRALVH
jgi:hypothetical protein